MNCEIQDGPRADELTLDRLLRALADPQRRAILHAVAAQPGVACAALLPEAPRSTVSVHLKALREAGLIAQEKRGQLVLNSLREEGAAAVFPEIVEAVLAAER